MTLHTALTALRQHPPDMGRALSALEAAGTEMDTREGAAARWAVRTIERGPKTPEPIIKAIEYALAR
jgi:hypothetical protein